MSDKAVEIVFLGTGAACPTRERSLPAALVKVAGRRYLVDCGEGTQRQLLSYGLGWKAPDAILITHLHLDHVLGLLGYLATLGRMGHDSPVPVCVPPGSLGALASMLTSTGLRGAARLFEASGSIADIPGGTVSSFDLTHTDIPCCGYLFALDGRWHLDADALERLGVPHGPARKELADGRSIVLSGGQVVLPERVRGRFQRLVQVAVAGDSSCWQELADRVNEVNLLVGEATYLDRDRALAEQNGHLTARQLALAGERAGAGWVVATHVSQRYTSAECLAELREVFPRSVVAEDGLSVGLSHAGEFFLAPYDKTSPP